MKFSVGLEEFIISLLEIRICLVFGNSDLGFGIKKPREKYPRGFNLVCGPRWTRTTDPLIMSQML